MKAFIVWLLNKFGLAVGKDDELAIDPSKDLVSDNMGFKLKKFHQTPNPEAAQFILDRDAVQKGTVTFESSEDAKGDAFAEALFKIYGVTDVFIKENFVTITKSPVVAWTGLMQPVEDVINSKLSYYSTVEENVKKQVLPTGDILKEVDVEDFPGFSDDQKGKIIDAVLEHAIRPALANDGGGITLVGVEGNMVRVHYQGACGSCPSSTLGTLQFIETFLQDTLSKDLKVSTT